VQNHCISLSKCEAALVRAGRLSQEQNTALAAGYFDIARAPATFGARTSFTVYAKTLDELIDKIMDLCPQFQPKDETRTFRSLQRLLGFKVTSHLLLHARSVGDAVRSKLRSTFLLGFVLRMRGVKLERDAKSRL
jgi:hypothetical protein